MPETSSSHDGYRWIVESFEEAVLACSATGFVTVVNGAAETLLGYRREYLTGRTLVELVAHDEAEAARALLGRVLAGERLRDHRLVARRAGGGTLEVSADLSPLFDDDGSAVAVVVVLGDAAARRRAAERRSQAARLESVGRLAGGIAHDFNNLMAVILNYASFVAQEVGDNETARADVEQIRNAAQRAADLTHQLLVFGRRETAPPEPLDLHAIVADLAEIVPVLGQGDIEVVVELAPSLPPLVAVPGQMEQVLVQLATNGAEAMPDGGRLTLRTEVVEVTQPSSGLEQPAPGRYVALSVSDQGIGMSAATVGLAFEPFFTTKSRGSGTGLGLAVVHGIVAEAGGLVELFSEEGRGTTVRVLLPVAEAAAPAAPAGAPSSDHPTEGGVILLVDDEEAMRKLTARLLRRNGFTVLEAATGGEALKLAADGSASLLLTDVVMPEMSGSELASQIRERHAELPVLFMSGYSQGALGSPQVLDDVELLEKPFDEQALLDKVRLVLATAAG
ncbi:MAG TPA: response regulator [Acidimicrobiales bacterium]|nr:response regulator [Acidimicrobiales bacterium]